MRLEAINSFYRVTDEEEEEKSEKMLEVGFCIVTKEIVKIFNHKRVLRLDKPSVYAFRQSGHQCKLEVAMSLLSLMKWEDALFAEPDSELSNHSRSKLAKA